MNIIPLIESIAGQVEGPPLFLHGDKAFQNLQDDASISNGVIYMDEPLYSNDNIKQSGYIEEVYPLKFLFAKKSELDWTPAQHQVIVQQCRELRRQFLVLLQNNAEVRSITSSKTTDIINLFDINLTGIYLELEVTPFNDDTNCPPEEEEEEGEGEEEEGTSELALVTSDFEIPLDFASTTTNSFFFKGSVQRTGLDVATDAWFDIFLTGGFKTVYCHGGAFTKVAHVIIGDTDRIGGDGNGHNAISPDCVTLPLPFDGELCGDFLFEGENLDFFNSHIDLVDLHDMQNIVTANISEGTIEEVYWQIDRTIAVTGQTVIPILFGLESPTTSTGDVVAIQTCQWIDLIEAEYPGQQFIFVFDVAALWSATGGETAYNAAIISNLSVPMEKVAIRVYCHGFKLWDDLLTGDVAHDVAAINTALTVTLPAFTAAIAASAFADCPVYIAQLSSSYFEGVPYNSPVSKGFYYFVSAYPRMLKHFIEQARDGGVNYFGVAPAGVNQWINAGNEINLDFKFYSVMNKLIEPSTFALEVTHAGTDVDIYGGKRGADYCLVINNRGLTDFVLPESVDFDGDVLGSTVAFSVGEYCTSAAADNSTTYTPGRTVRGNSIAYVELTPVAP